MKVLHCLVRSALFGTFLLWCASAAFAQNGLWINVQPPSAPPFRGTHGLATEPNLGVTVLYGGQGGTTVYDETWIFDGCTWGQFPNANQPGPRTNTYMATSPTPGRVVLFGGSDALGALQPGTWELDFTTGTWIDMTPVGASPPLRIVHSMVLDTVRGKVVLFGGATASYASLGDTWEWDGSTWTDVTPTAASPAPRAWHAMAFDSARGKTVLFGGYNGSQLGDTWEWDGFQWTQIFTSSSPSPRSSVVGAYDANTQRVVVFGGSQGWPIGLDDTWEFDGTNWSQVTIAGTPPPPEFLHRVANDPARGGIILFGAYGNGWSTLGDTWRYQRASLTASTLTPATGTTLTYTLSLPNDAFLSYVAAISVSGSCPGIPLSDGRFIPLNFDDVTSLSISGLVPQIFQNFVGALSGSGSASPAIAIPAVSGLSGIAVTAAAVTFSGPNILSITNSLNVVIQ